MEIFLRGGLDTRLTIDSVHEIRFFAQAFSPDSREEGEQTYKVKRVAGFPWSRFRRPMPADGNMIARGWTGAQEALPDLIPSLKRNPDAAEIGGKFQPGPRALQRDDDAFFVLQLHAAGATHQRAADTDG
jgi:hypothetical protein